MAILAMFALGLKRCQIAAAFGRDLRPVRSSVIDGTPRNPNRLIRCSEVCPGDFPVAG